MRRLKRKRRKMVRTHAEQLLRNAASRQPHSIASTRRRSSHLSHSCPLSVCVVCSFSETARNNRAVIRRGDGEGGSPDWYEEDARGESREHR